MLGNRRVMYDINTFAETNLRRNNEHLEDEFKKFLAALITSIVLLFFVKVKFRLINFKSRTILTLQHVIN